MHSPLSSSSQAFAAISCSVRTGTNKSHSSNNNNKYLEITTLLLQSRVIEAIVPCTNRRELNTNRRSSLPQFQLLRGPSCNGATPIRSTSTKKTSRTDPLLKMPRKDFVIYLGDVITANNLLTANVSLYWDGAISPTRDRGIHWAFLGNYDDATFEWLLEWFFAAGIPQLHCSLAIWSFSGGGCNFRGTMRLELMEMETRNALSYSKIGPKEVWPVAGFKQISKEINPDSRYKFCYVQNLVAINGS